jgi:hypothetical protein
MFADGIIDESKFTSEIILKVTVLDILDDGSVFLLALA